MDKTYEWNSKRGVQERPDSAVRLPYECWVLTINDHEYLSVPSYGSDVHYALPGGLIVHIAEIRTLAQIGKARAITQFLYARHGASLYRTHYPKIVQAKTGLT